MKAMFRVTFRTMDHAKTNSPSVFTNECVLAATMGKAIEIAEREVKRIYTSEQLFATDVELLGVETIER